MRLASTSNVCDNGQGKEVPEMKEKIVRRGYTFDDVLLLPRYSEIIPSQVDTTSRLTKKIRLKTPLLSAAMDRVTESAMAIALAKVGGIGIVHKNLSIAEQAEEVKKVKKVVLSSEEKTEAATDEDGKLLCGAGIGITKDLLERAEALLQCGSDVLVLDSAHGHSHNVLMALEKVKSAFPSAQVIVGNVATYEGARALMEKGADAVKVGMGPGSICTTRIISGMGVPQLTAILDCSKAAEEHSCPIIADGGIRYSGDITKALAAGADTVMLGSLFASCFEAPGEVFEVEGRKFKSYRGMGSLGAMEQAHGSSDRYFQSDQRKLVPEGVEGMVPLSGSVADLVFELMGGLRSGMGYLGVRTIEELKREAQFIEISSASLLESHPHEVKVTKKSPNY